MAEDATSTYIVDHEAASHSLASMAARAQVMGETLKGIVDRIASTEAGRPWGTAEEYGGRFEAVYHAGGAGSEFVRTNAHILATETIDGLTKAHQALLNSVEVDTDGAKLFQVNDSAAVGSRLSDINAAAQQAAQQE